MTAQIIDGTAIAQKVRDEVKEKVAKRIAEGKSQPGLATLLVGERIDSATYVSMKQKACAELGMTSFHQPLPADITQADLEKLIKELNADPKVSGILVQLPLPSHLDEERVSRLISLEKDVDGFS
ncbi:MAG: tetrahydrofolate dehydrogenase/cyclohydrolase catalytic domain-containing protein, partial [Chloroflexota bacterium]